MENYINAIRGSGNSRGSSDIKVVEGGSRGSAEVEVIEITKREIKNPLIRSSITDAVINFSKVDDGDASLRNSLSKQMAVYFVILLLSASMFVQPLLEVISTLLRRNG